MFQAPHAWARGSRPRVWEAAQAGDTPSEAPPPPLVLAPNPNQVTIFTESAACAAAVRHFDSSDFGGWMLACKLTFALEPGRMCLLSVADPIETADRFWDDDPCRSVAAASDMAPVKAWPEFTVVGSAFAELDRRSSGPVACRVRVGECEKRFNVWPRSDVPPGTTMRVPLRYERAAGGPKTWNPVGLPRPGDGPFTGGGMPTITAHDDLGGAWKPFGLGPMPPAWPLRARLWTGMQDEMTAMLDERRLPNGVPAEFFNAAPIDQRLAFLDAEAPVELDSLLRHHPKLRTRLPGLDVAAMTMEDGGRTERLAMFPDTVILDTDRATCSVVFRGQFQAQQRFSVSVGLRRAHPRTSGIRIVPPAASSRRSSMG